MNGRSASSYYKALTEWSVKEAILILSCFLVGCLHETAFTLCGTAVCAYVMTYFIQIKNRETAPSTCVKMHSKRQTIS